MDRVRSQASTHSNESFRREGGESQGSGSRRGSGSRPGSGGGPGAESPQAGQPRPMSSYGAPPSGSMPPAGMPMYGGPPYGYAPQGAPRPDQQYPPQGYGYHPQMYPRSQYLPPHPQYGQQFGPPPQALPPQYGYSRPIRPGLPPPPGSPYVRPHGGYGPGGYPPATYGPGGAPSHMHQLQPPPPPNGYPAPARSDDGRGSDPSTPTNMRPGAVTAAQPGPPQDPENQSFRSNASVYTAQTSATLTSAVGSQPESLEVYRQNAKKSSDPAYQLTFAKHLIATGEAISLEQGDVKRNKRHQEALYTEALKLIKKLVTTGGIGKSAHADAQFFLAECYGNGTLNLPVDHDRAFSLYVQASKQSHPAATYRTAVCYEVGAGTKRDSSRAMQFYRKAAALGDTAAMYKVGMIMMNGLLGQAANPREGVTWLKRAAAQADENTPHALHELGVLYEGGSGDTTGVVIPDPQHAHERFLQAAQLGYAASQFKLGFCYEYGLLHLPVDPRRSIAWYTRAAEQSDPDAELALSGWYLTGAEGVLRQSDTEAYLWARKAADKGLAKAEYAVGWYSENGVGVQADFEEARRWYLRAAAQGNKRAIARVKELKSMMYATQRGTGGGQQQHHAMSGRGGGSMRGARPAPPQQGDAHGGAEQRRGDWRKDGQSQSGGAKDSECVIM
ncbi:hypothetical protein HDU86_000955 [Geranomyces michiganensis]|nr:hypothetical protein HDU86_000955 [Geranomyces michiganensis]